MKTQSKKLDYLKDKIFDLLNDADELGIRDIETNDKKGIFKVFLQDGNMLEVECRQLICQRRLLWIKPKHILRTKKG